jgi:CheY-like chemotaxis protein
MPDTPSILVVEDEDMLREVVVEALEAAGWATHGSATGEDAVGLIDRLPRLDALLTDIRLPGAVDGWAVAERFRARHERGAVIYATAFSATHTPVSGSMFFRKPYKLQQILLCLDALVPTRQRPPGR